MKSKKIPESLWDLPPGIFVEAAITLDKQKVTKSLRCCFHLSKAPKTLRYPSVAEGRHVGLRFGTIVRAGSRTGMSDCLAQRRHRVPRPLAPAHGAGYDPIPVTEPITLPPGAPPLPPLPEGFGYTHWELCGWGGLEGSNGRHWGRWKEGRSDWGDLHPAAACSIPDCFYVSASRDGAPLNPSDKPEKTRAKVRRKILV